jgi:ParB-like chromosome segregation protein Spo0J
MTSASLEVRTLPVSQLTPAAYNPRKTLRPSDPAYRKLRRSIEEFGLVEPLIWNEVSGRLVGGHARMRILRELGVTEVAVSVVHLDEVREKALNIVLNNQEAQGRYDPSKLAELLTELRDLPEMELTGFAPSLIDALHMEAVDPLPPEEPRNRVELLIRTSPEQFQAVQPRLDELIREFDLEVHVKRSA